MESDITALLAPLGPTLLVFGVALTILPFIDRANGTARIFVFGGCGLLLWRYFYWRLTATIPPLAFTGESILSWSFAGLEALAGFSSSFALLTLMRWRDRRGEATENIGWLNELALPPRVDVLIATYNEEEPILERTIVGALAIDFPNVVVWVLDDGRRDWLKRLCELKGVRYLARPNNEGAKAGNLNHALKIIRREPTPPEFILMLDADFVPYPHILRRIVPLFHDRRVALVQTPQYFFNKDPVQANLLLGDVWPDEQRFFFDYLLPAKDAWGTAFCCGTSSVIRCDALAEIGDFPTETVTEDFMTSLMLAARGWKTVYLAERVSAGLAPEGIKEYLTQRGRWCLGFMQILRSGVGPFGRSDLPWRYRLSLIDTFTYWCATYLFKFACLIVPIIYWLTGMTAIHATPQAMLSYFLPSYAALMCALGWAAGGTIKPVLTDVTQVLTMFQALQGTAIGLFGPKDQKFKVTAKGLQRDRITVQWSMILRFGVLALLTVGAVAFATGSDFAQPQHQDVGGRAIIMFWSAYNVVILLLAMAVCVELPRYRKEERFSTDEPVTFRLTDGTTYDARVRDISISGARLSFDVPMAAGTPVVLSFQHAGETAARVTSAHAANRELTVAFDHTELTRAAMIRKIFSGRYQPREDAPARTGKIAAALLARYFR
jgi:cellulose synthase (UDP-forming)